MQKVKRHKIYYIPGMISLILLPFFFIHFAERESQSNASVVIRINWLNSEFIKKNIKKLPEYKGHFPPKRNYIDINLTGNKFNDRIKLDFAQLRIREILSKNDSITGVHFNFGDSSQYGLLVEALNILEIEGAKTYAPNEYDLWFYSIPSVQKLFTEPQLYSLSNDVLTLAQEVPFLIRVKQWGIHFWETSGKLVSAFLLFLFFIYYFQK